MCGKNICAAGAKNITTEPRDTGDCSPAGFPPSFTVRVAIRTLPLSSCSHQSHRVHLMCWCVQGNAGREPRGIRPRYPRVSWELRDGVFRSSGALSSFSSHVTVLRYIGQKPSALFSLTGVRSMSSLPWLSVGRHKTSARYILC